MAAKTQQERSAKAALKRAELDETELRHRCRRGTRDKLAELMAWHGITEQAEAIQLLIMNAHALGADGSAALLAVPRHEIVVTPSVARRLQEAGARQAGLLDQADQ